MSAQHLIENLLFYNNNNFSLKLNNISPEAIENSGNTIFIKKKTFIIAIFVSDSLSDRFKNYDGIT